MSAAIFGWRRALFQRSMDRDQGIRKGPAIQSPFEAAIELAWMWPDGYQPDKNLRIWFRQRVGDRKGDESGGMPLWRSHAKLLVAMMGRVPRNRPGGQPEQFQDPLIRPQAAIRVHSPENLSAPRGLAKIQGAMALDRWPGHG